MKEYTVKNNDFSEFENNPDLSLIKIDKNGSHHYINHVCPKCGGTGNIEYYHHVESGRCFKCEGSGRYEHKMVVRTEEYTRKLEEQRVKRNRADAIKKNAVFFKKEGFTPDGKTYIVLGNTFPIKEELKKLGAFFNYQLGWHFNHPVSIYPTCELDKDEVVGTCYGEEVHLLQRNEFGAYGYQCVMESFVQQYIKNIQNEYLKTVLPETHWFGNVGQRVTVANCEYRLLTSWYNHFGETHIYKFISPDGFIFTWKTGKFLGDEGKATITGTIKEHSEYKGQKQTELTRCKIS